MTYVHSILLPQTDAKLLTLKTRI